MLATAQAAVLLTRASGDRRLDRQVAGAYFAAALALVAAGVAGFALGAVHHENSVELCAALLVALLHAALSVVRVAPHGPFGADGDGAWWAVPTWVLLLAVAVSGALSLREFGWGLFQTFRYDDRHLKRVYKGRLWLRALLKLDALVVALWTLAATCAVLADADADADLALALVAASAASSLLWLGATAAFVTWERRIALMLAVPLALLLPAVGIWLVSPPEYGWPAVHGWRYTRWRTRPGGGGGRPRCAATPPR